MSVLTCNHPALKPLFDALGVKPSKTRRIVITIGGDSPIVTVNIENLLTDLDGQIISDLVSSHVLVERKIKP